MKMHAKLSLTPNPDDGLNYSLFAVRIFVFRYCLTIIN